MPTRSRGGGADMARAVNADPGRVSPWLRGRAAFRNYQALVDERDTDHPDGALACAIEMLGPAREIPEVTVAHLRRLAATPGIRSGPFDITMGFGCGWDRPGATARVGWDGVWEPAFFALVSQVEASLRATAQLFAAQLPAFAVSADDLAELPTTFAVALVWGCDCGHHVRTCINNACASACCFAPHALRSWDPSQANLRCFVDQAVRGSAELRIRGAAFAESLLYHAWRGDGRVLCRPVEFGRCAGCDAVFESARCPECGPGAVVRRFARQNWLVRSADSGGGHQRVTRWRCGNTGCESLYPQGPWGTARPAARCPACGWVPVGRPATTLVWARTRPDPGGRPL